jgi:flagellar motor switch protein FliG
MSTALAEQPQTAHGIARSAALMQALGEDASAIWSVLTPEEATRLRAAMQDVAPDMTANATESYLTAMTLAETTPTKTTTDLSSLAPDQVPDLVTFIAPESPQIAALVLSILPEETAAATVQALPKQIALKALYRMMGLTEVHPSALTAIETAYVTRQSTRASQSARSGQDRLAGIMNRIDSRLAPVMMAGLEELEPGSAERIRGLMFTFDDLATLDPASVQTLLASIDRAVLITALQDASDVTADAFYRNMTQRAAEVLRSEIESNGPFRRNEIEQARQDIAALARKLARRGDLLSNKGPDAELVE